MYADRLKALLNSPETALFEKLKTPSAIQDYLDSLSVNFEQNGETYMSPRRAIRAGVAHCFEGALIAAAALGYHGQKPYLMDFQTAWDDEDHVVALFHHEGLWGALSKTNHAVLRYRDAVYKSPRELAMSYFHEYFMWDGRKSLRAYSAPFDLSKYAPEKWVTAGEDLEWLVDVLDKSPHFPIAPKKIVRALRKASKIEIQNLRTTEWEKSSTRSNRSKRSKR